MSERPGKAAGAMCRVPLAACPPVLFDGCIGLAALLRRLAAIAVLAVLSASPAFGQDQEVAATRLPEGLLEGVAAKDLTTKGLSYEESDSYYAILEFVRQQNPSALHAAGSKTISERRARTPQSAKPSKSLTAYPIFVDLVQNPEELQGRAVTLSGHLIRLVTYPADENEHGIEQLYEAWLVTPHSQMHPAVVVTTSIPEGMPIGEKIINGVRVSGYFFKLFTYSSRDDKGRFAPMILASQLDWSPEPTPGGSDVLAAVGFVVALLCLVAAASYFAFRTRRRRIGERISPASFERIDLSGPMVDESGESPEDREPSA